MVKNLKMLKIVNRCWHNELNNGLTLLYNLLNIILLPLPQFSVYSTCMVRPTHTWEVLLFGMGNNRADSGEEIKQMQQGWMKGS